MKVKFYGTRGSYPVPGETTTRYGGNTTCVSISKEIAGKIYRINIDCGTGGVELGKEILKNFFDGKEIMNVLFLFTHLHPDHNQGFPFFTPNYFNECTMNLMGMESLKKNVGVVLEQTMLPPTFPIEYKDLKSSRKHHKIKDGDSFEYPNKTLYPDAQIMSVFSIQAMQAYSPSHPQQGAIYYKITDNETGKSVACIWDLESHPGGDMRVINFSKNCDIMIHDTQYTTDEYQDQEYVVQGFGHSTYDMALDNASKACIKKALVCTHFNPAHSDEKLDEIYSKYNKPHSNASGGAFQLIMAKEGLEIEV